MSRTKTTTNRYSAMADKAFTLIELLIVVAIIAILAAIAVPNFLEAQTRAKVSRAKSDLRSITTALESYAVDWSTYPPNDGLYNEVPAEITTPVAFIVNSELYDPFAQQKSRAITIDEATSPYYSYMQIVTFNEALFWQSVGRTCPSEAIDHVTANFGAFRKYGKWRMHSIGPDLQYLDLSQAPPLRGSDTIYDPTNGTKSFGNILRTQLQKKDKW